MNGPYQVPSYPGGPRGFPTGPRRPSETEVLQKQVGEQIADLAGRIKVVEERMETIRSHVSLIDGTVLEKHKATTADVRDVQSSMRSLRADLDEIKEFSERIIKRMEALASKEEVKVLERYIEAWQPLNYITRSDLKVALIQMLKDLGIKVKEK